MMSRPALMLTSWGRRLPGRPMSTVSSCYHGYEFDTLSVTQPLGNVMQVEINRPGRANAMNDTFFSELGKCFGQLSIDPDCRAVVLSGAGKTFTAGLDLQEHADLFRRVGGGGGGGDNKRGTDIERRDAARLSFSNMRFISGWQQSITSLERCPKPVVAAIHSACVGAGVDLVCAADIRMASADAWFSIKEVRLSFPSLPFPSLPSSICPPLWTGGKGGRTFPTVMFFHTLSPLAGVPPTHPHMYY
ncbi:unnamed protein product [Discosporangium mesarthrocarpum]